MVGLERTASRLGACTHLQAHTHPPFTDSPFRYLTELELRLQLASEDIVGKLADASSRASLRVPSALKELLNIQARRQSSRVKHAEGIRVS